MEKLGKAVEKWFLRSVNPFLKIFFPPHPAVPGYFGSYQEIQGKNFSGGSFSPSQISFQVGKEKLGRMRSQEKFSSSASWKRRPWSARISQGGGNQQQKQSQDLEKQHSHTSLGC